MFGAQANFALDLVNNSVSTAGNKFSTIQEAKETTDKLFSDKNFNNYIIGCKATARLQLTPGNGWIAGDVSDPKRQFSSFKDHL